MAVLSGIESVAKNLGTPYEQRIKAIWSLVNSIDSRLEALHDFMQLPPMQDTAINVPKSPECNAIAELSDLERRLEKISEKLNSLVI